MPRKRTSSGYRDPQKKRTTGDALKDSTPTSQHDVNLQSQSKPSIRRRLLEVDLGLNPPLLPASAETRGNYTTWLCGRGLAEPKGDPNAADYGPCVATLFDSLDVNGLPTRDKPGYAGVPIELSVLKIDRYGQVITSDSNSSVQVYSALNGKRVNDDSVTIQGSIYSGFVRGEASLSIAVKPSFSNISGGRTELLRQPFLYIAGNDALNKTAGSSMQTPVYLVHLAQGDQSPCPQGAVLTLSNGSLQGFGRFGECTLCKAGTYSLSPLAGPSSSEPGCFSCPVSLQITSHALPNLLAVCIAKTSHTRTYA